MLVFHALGKQPGTHRPELYRQEIHSQAIIDVTMHDIRRCQF